MEVHFDNKAMLTNTRNEMVAEAEIDNFKEGIQFDAYLANNKIRMRWTVRVSVGNAHGMSFTSTGPVANKIKKGKRK